MSEKKNEKMYIEKIIENKKFLDMLFTSRAIFVVTFSHHVLIDVYVAINVSTDQCM